ncbi:MAG: sulfite exporter TauE/SafE family protein [Ketobacteraceae bacterium]|nr:sulfite exporter TauE/SafE family protein [Ketobacteraceae bacterium]
MEENTFAIVSLILPVLPPLIMILAATLQASVGYGYGIVAVPLLLLVNPAFIPAPFIFASLILMMSVSFTNRKALSGQRLGWIFVGLVAGTPVGVLLLTYFKDINYSLAVAGIILFGVLLSFLRTPVPINPLTQSFCGFLSAVMGTATGVGGAPIALLYQYETGWSIRAVLSVVFCMASLFSFIGVLAGGLFLTEQLLLSLQLIPGVFAGHWLGARLAPWIDRGYSRPAILILSIASVAAVLLKNT